MKRKLFIIFCLSKELRNKALSVFSSNENKPYGIKREVVEFYDDLEGK